jgi:hypothetical protein
MASVTTGLENCLESPPKVLRDAARFGVLTNQASVNKEFDYASTLLARRFPGRSAQRGHSYSSQDFRDSGQRSLGLGANCRDRGCLIRGRTAVA